MQQTGEERASKPEAEGPPLGTRLRVLIQTAALPPRRGGVPQSLAALCRHFAPEQIAALTNDMPGARECDAPLPYRVFRFPRRLLGGLYSRSTVRFAAAWLRYHDYLARAVRQFQPDVVFTFNTSLHHLASCYALRQTRRIPYIAYCHGEDVPLPGMLRKNDHLRLPLLNRADRILTNSLSTQRGLETLGCGLGRTEVICAGIDTDRLTPGDGLHLRRQLGIGTNDPVLLTVGRLDRRKGHDLVILALPVLRQKFPDLKYVIVGEGIERNPLDHLAREREVRDMVLFREFQPDEVLADYYRMCDVFLMPNRTLPDGDAEGLGLVFLEANACGKAVIGGRSGGAVDAIVHDATGLLVEPDDLAELVAAVGTLLCAPELRQRLGAAGHERAVTEFSNRGQAARFWGAFAHVAGNRYPEVNVKGDFPLVRLSSPVSGADSTSPENAPHTNVLERKVY